MTGFSLFSIAPALLEKTIRKLESKSYFRIRQTCHGANEFIRNSSTISVSWYGYGHFTFDKKRDLYVLKINGVPFDVDIDTLYGIRIHSLLTPDNIPKNNKQLCNLLKHNRITCREVEFWGGEWNADQWEAFLKALKPISVKLYSNQSTLYEPLLAQKTLKSVHVTLESDEVADVTEKLLATGFRMLSIDVPYCSTSFALFCSILKLLCSTSFPKVHKFRFSVAGHEDMPPKDELEKKICKGLQGQLRSFRVERMVHNVERSETVRAAVDIPSHVSNGCICKITISNRNHCQVEYHKL